MRQPLPEDEKSSTEYGLATKNAASATPPTMRDPAQRAAPAAGAANCAAAAATIGSSTIPPVYFVAHASPSPSPAQT